MSVVIFFVLIIILPSILHLVVDSWEYGEVFTSGKCKYLYNCYPSTKIQNTTPESTALKVIDR